MRRRLPQSWHAERAALRCARAAEGGRATTQLTDVEWDPEEVAGASDEEDSDAEDIGAYGGTNRGRVTAHYTV